MSDIRLIPLDLNSSGMKNKRKLKDVISTPGGPNILPSGKGIRNTTSVDLPISFADDLIVGGNWGPSGKTYVDWVEQPGNITHCNTLFSNHDTMQLWLDLMDAIESEVPM
jgi:hypothetical protein